MSDRIFTPEYFKASDSAPCNGYIPYQVATEINGAFTLLQEAAGGPVKVTRTIMNGYQLLQNKTHPGSIDHAMWDAQQDSNSLVPTVGQWLAGNGSKLEYGLELGRVSVPLDAAIAPELEALGVRTEAGPEANGVRKGNTYLMPQDNLTFLYAGRVAVELMGQEPATQDYIAVASTSSEEPAATFVATSVNSRLRSIEPSPIPVVGA